MYIFVLCVNSLCICLFLVVKWDGLICHKVLPVMRVGEVYWQVKESVWHLVPSVGKFQSQKLLIII